MKKNKTLKALPTMKGIISRIRFAAVSLGVITPIDALTKNQLINTKFR